MGTFLRSLLATITLGVLMACNNLPAMNDPSQDVLTMLAANRDLLAALAANDSERVAALLRVANLVQAAPYIRRTLQSAIVHNNAPMIRVLEDFIVPRSLLDAVGVSTLPIVQLIYTLLSQRGFAFGAANDYGRSVVAEAFTSGNIAVVHYLVTHGARLPANLLFVAYRPGRTHEGLPLSDNARYALLNYALDHGTPIDSLMGGRTLLQRVYETEQYPMARWLIERGARITNLPHFSLSNVFDEPLLQAIALRSTGKALSLLSHKTPHEIASLAVAMASAHGLSEVVAAILERFDNLLNLDDIAIALKRAALNGRKDIIDMLLNAWAGSIEHNSAEWVPYLEQVFLLAAVQGHVDTVQTLLTFALIHNVNVPLGSIIRRLRFMLTAAVLGKQQRKNLLAILTMLEHGAQARSKTAAGGDLPIPIYERVGADVVGKHNSN